jgi:hypothetical protein
MTTNINRADSKPAQVQEDEWMHSLQFFLVLPHEEMPQWLPFAGWLTVSTLSSMRACLHVCVCVCVFVCSRVCACAYAYQRHQDVMRYLFCSRQSAMAACILKLTGVHFARAQLYTNPHEVEDPNPHGSAENIVIFKVPFMCLRRHTGVRCANALVIRLAFANILRHICNRGYIM